MSVLKQNMTNGKMYNYSLFVQLPTGKVRLALPNTKDDKRLANRLKAKADDIERTARQFPTEKDWYVELHMALGMEHKLPNHFTDKHTIKSAWNQMLDSKQLLKDVNKQSTLDFYRFSYQLLLDVIGNMSLDMISLQHKPQIEQAVGKTDWSDTTKNMRVRYINTFFKWCYDNQLIDKIPFKLQLIKTTARTKTWISESDFNTICSVSDEVYVSYFKIAYNTGLRLRELNTNPKDKAYNGLYHTISRVDSLWQLRVYGKQGKEAVIVLPNELKPYYDLMVANRLHPRTITKKFKQACKSVGFDNFRFHDLRHSFCQNLAMITGDSAYLKAKMRHSSIGTTETYLKDDRFNWTKIVETERYEG